MVDKKKAYFNDVKGLIKEKLDVIDMRMTTDTEISEFDIELLEMAIDKLREYNEYATSKKVEKEVEEFANSIIGYNKPTTP